MYKDQDKQKEANRERQRRYKAKQKALLNQGVTGGDQALPKQGVTAECLTEDRDPKPIEVKGVANQGIDFDEFSKTHIIATLIDPNKRTKRGKDIKCFADLPPDVQRTIDMMSTVDGKIDQTIKANRTAIAVNYQHLFPDRYHSTGL